MECKDLIRHCDWLATDNLLILLTQTGASSANNLATFLDISVKNGAVTLEDWYGDNLHVIGGVTRHAVTMIDVTVLTYRVP